MQFFVSKKGMLTIKESNLPGGTPASWASSAMANADKGVSSAGLITQVHPAAMAAPALRVIMAFGKFHYVRQKHFDKNLS